MRDRQPPTNDEIKEHVKQILHGADLEKITMKMVYNQVCSHYPDFDLAHKKDFIKATVKSAINLEPTIAQMEKLVKFLEENPEIAKGTDRLNNTHESRRQKTQKWEAVAKELNLMGGANRPGYSWAKLWDVSRSHVNHIIAERKSATGACGGIIQPYTPEMMERMIILLEGLGIEEIPAELPSTTNLEPTIAQMEKLVKFLEENPEIATGIDHAKNAHESLQRTQKWEAIAEELNLMEGANRSGYSWAELWDVSRSRLNHIIADRKSVTGACGGIIQPYTPEMMERMIILLEGLGIDEIPAESPSDDEIKNCVKQILEGADLEQITMKMVYQQVYSHFPNFDLTHKKDFIRATVKSCI